MDISCHVQQRTCRTQQLRHSYLYIRFRNMSDRIRSSHSLDLKSVCETLKPEGEGGLTSATGSVSARLFTGRQSNKRISQQYNRNILSALQLYGSSSTAALRSRMVALVGGGSWLQLLIQPTPQNPCPRPHLPDPSSFPSISSRGSVNKRHLPEQHAKSGQSSGVC